MCISKIAKTTVIIIIIFTKCLRELFKTHHFFFIKYLIKSTKSLYKEFKFISFKSLCAESNFIFQNNLTKAKSVQARAVCLCMCEKKMRFALGRNKALSSEKFYDSLKYSKETTSSPTLVIFN